MIRATVYQQFSSELLERVAAMERHVHAAERGRDPAQAAEPLADAAFEAHSIKGTAAVLGLHDLATLAAEFERGVQTAAERPAPLEAAAAARLREGLRAMAAMADRQPAGVERPARPEIVAPDAPRTHHRAVVLHIEDSGMVVDLVAAILEGRRDIALRSAGTAAEGLALARRLRPAVILLDMHLPDSSGDEVLAAILSDPRTRDIPVVIVSGDRSDEEAARLLAAGAADCLPKPFEIEAVLALVGRYCGGETD